MPAPLTLPRSSGVLLHPTSLPGPYGIGDFGPEAYRWVQTLAAAGQTWWQILPLGPPGAGHSPYQSYSAFAGNVALLSPELLARDGLVGESLLHGHSFPADHVDFQHVAPFKRFLVRTAWDYFRGGKGPAGLKAEFDEYRAKEAGWLDDYALFAAVRESLGGIDLVDWPADLLHRDPVALAAVEKSLAAEVMAHQFGQFLFDRQWADLRTFAATHNVRIIGDAPIFVSGNSADVWANHELFLLDKDRRPHVVAGVPPDYFSPTGQLWGNPLYDWERMGKDGYEWWAARIERDLARVDLIRLDHFRGFAAAWHVPVGDPDATNGEWVDGPRAKLFDRLQAELGSLPLIAEDLGLITPDVHALRERFGLPGMRVLQFALGEPDNPYWPHNFEPNTVAYTGTHDNDTTAGWFHKLNNHDRWVMGEYQGHPMHHPGWDLVRMAWASVAVLAVAPLQDLLELGGEARMNTPGVPDGNWGWRVRPDQFPHGLTERLADLTRRYDRNPAIRAAKKEAEAQQKAG